MPTKDGCETGRRRNHPRQGRSGKPAGEAVPGISLPPLPSANATVPAKAVDLSTLTIPQRLEQGTVLILAPVPGGAQQGTGFFINPIMC